MTRMMNDNIIRCPQSKLKKERNPENTCYIFMRNRRKFKVIFVFEQKEVKKKISQKIKRNIDNLIRITFYRGLQVQGEKRKYKIICLKLKELKFDYEYDK